MPYNPEILIINKLNDLLNLLDKLSNGHRKQLNSDKWYFRGQADDWQLIPSVFRPNNKRLLEKLYYLERPNYPTNSGNIIEYERNIIRLFLVLADEKGVVIPNYNSETKEKYFSFDCTISGGRQLPKYRIWDTPYHDFLGLAQHYGVPTRLLDWSKSFKIALFFATRNTKDNKSGNYVVWSFMHSRDRHLSGDYAGTLKLLSPPRGTNHNLRAQEGVFTIVSNDHMNDQVWLDHYLGAYLVKIIFPVSICCDILAYLDSEKVTEESLFPDNHSDDKKFLDECSKHLLAGNTQF